MFVATALIATGVAILAELWRSGTDKTDVDLALLILFISLSMIGIGLFTPLHQKLLGAIVCSTIGVYVVCFLDSDSRFLMLVADWRFAILSGSTLLASVIGQSLRRPGVAVAWVLVVVGSLMLIATWCVGLSQSIEIEANPGAIRDPDFITNYFRIGKPEGAKPVGPKGPKQSPSPVQQWHVAPLYPERPPLVPCYP